MGMMGIGMKVGFPEVNDGLIFVRSVKKITPPMVSVLEFEAAAILIAMAYSVPDVDAFCNSELEKFNNGRDRPDRKRKAPMKNTREKQRRKKKSKRKDDFVPSISDMPAAMRERIGEMGGYEIQLVIQKQLQDTDLNKNHGRLSLPTKQLLFDFATEGERDLLSRVDDKNKRAGMNVAMIDPVLREGTICLKKWKIGSDNVYCLMTNWNSFVEDNALKSGEYVQVWCFRRDELEPQTQTVAASRLCFAMVKLHNTDSLMKLLH